MHRTISGDLQNEEEMDRAMEEAGEEGIYQVRNTLQLQTTAIQTKYRALIHMFSLSFISFGEIYFWIE